MKHLALGLAAAALLATACGGGSSKEGDVDSESDVIPDTHADTDAGDVPEDDAAGEPPEDTATDGDAPDPEDIVDTVEIVDAADTVEVVDAADTLDAADTSPDIPVDGTCLPLEASISAVDSWVLCFMGTGTHASFTIDYENNSTGCDLSSIAVTGGDLRLSSSDASIMAFGATPPATPFSGNLAASTAASVDYHASDTTLDTSGYNGQSVYVEVDISYSTPYVTGTLTVTSADTTHTCVY